VLEIGAARVYSAIWMGLALRDTGGSLVTIEFDPLARKRPRPTSSAPASRRQCGSSAAMPSRDSEGRGTFDLVFLDAWKPDYKKFFDLGVSAARCRRRLRRAQRRQQAQ
jgi:predicted O-methyltransferase YrrM